MAPPLTHAAAYCPEPDIAIQDHANNDALDGNQTEPEVEEYHIEPPLMHATWFCPLTDVAMDAQLDADMAVTNHVCP